jgi:hypothetical protein
MVKFCFFLTKHNAMKGEHSFIDRRFLYLGTSWRSVVSSFPQPLKPWYPLYRRMGGPQSPSG